MMDDSQKTPRQLQQPQNQQHQQQQQRISWRGGQCNCPEQQQQQAQDQQYYRQQYQQLPSARHQQARGQRYKQRQQQIVDVTHFGAGSPFHAAGTHGKRLPPVGRGDARACVAELAAADTPGNVAFKVWRSHAAPGDERSHDRKQNESRRHPGFNRWPKSSSRAVFSLATSGRLCRHWHSGGPSSNSKPPFKLQFSPLGYSHFAPPGWHYLAWGPQSQFAVAGATVLPVQQFYYGLSDGRQQEVLQQREQQQVQQPQLLLHHTSLPPVLPHRIQHTLEYPNMTIASILQHPAQGYMMQVRHLGRPGPPVGPNGSERVDSNNTTPVVMQQPRDSDELSSPVASSTSATANVSAGYTAGSAHATESSSTQLSREGPAYAAAAAHGSTASFCTAHLAANPYAFLRVDRLQEWQQQQPPDSQQQQYSHWQNWQRWYQMYHWHQDWSQWQQMQHSVSTPVEINPYGEHNHHHQNYHHQCSCVVQQQSNIFGKQRATRPNKHYQRDPKRSSQLQPQQSREQQEISWTGRLRRGPQRQLQQQQQQQDVVAAADIAATTPATVPHAAETSVSESASPELPLSEATSAFEATPISPQDTVAACTPAWRTVRSVCVKATAVHGAPCSSPRQNLRHPPSTTSKPSKNKEKFYCGRHRSLHEKQKLIASSQQLVEGPPPGTTGSKWAGSSIPAGAEPPCSREGAEDTAPAATANSADDSSCGQYKSASPHSESSSSRTTKSRNSTSSDSARCPNSHVLPKEGYCYTKNLAYLTPPVERKKVGPQDFVLMQVLGKGSYGKVLLVKFKQDGQLYALKVLQKDSLLRRSQVQHTRTERAVLEVISHPFIVQMHFAFQTPKKLYFVLEYCPGGELFLHLQRWRRFTEPRARFYAAELLLALQHLHKHNVIYRDLKPENILLDAEGHIRLTDFGLSKSGIADNNSARSICGTPEYIAPEILCQVGHGKAADWWSFGAVLYEMLTGLPPFYTVDQETLFSNILWGGLEFPLHVSPLAVELLRGLLHRDANKRLGAGPSDAEEIKSHPFFRSVNWELLLARKVRPPFRPRLDSDDDSKYFPEFKEEPVISGDEVGPDSAFGIATRTGGTATSEGPRTPNPCNSSSRDKGANHPADGVGVSTTIAALDSAVPVAQPTEAPGQQEPHEQNGASLSPTDSQSPGEDEEEGLFVGFTYDERVQECVARCIF